METIWVWPSWRGVSGLRWEGGGEGGFKYLEAAGDQGLVEEGALRADDAAVAADLFAGAEADFEVAGGFGLPEAGEGLAEGFFGRVGGLGLVLTLLRRAVDARRGSRRSRSQEGCPRRGAKALASTFLRLVQRSGTEVVLWVRREEGRHFEGMD